MIKIREPWYSLWNNHPKRHKAYENGRRVTFETAKKFDVWACIFIYFFYALRWYNKNPHKANLVGSFDVGRVRWYSIKKDLGPHYLPLRHIPTIDGLIKNFTPYYNDVIKDDSKRTVENKYNPYTWRNHFHSFFKGRPPHKLSCTIRYGDIEREKDRRRIG